MLDSTKRGKRLIAYLIGLLLILNQFFVFAPAKTYAEEAEGNVPVVGAEQETSTKATSDTVLAFTSDTHNASGNSAANRLGTWLDNMKAKYGHVDLMAFGGDMASAGSNGNTFWTLTQADMDMMTTKGVPAIYTTGNHEYMNGSYSNGSNETTKNFKEDQAVINSDDYSYRMYCLGSGSYANGGGWNTYDSDQDTKLKSFLNSCGNDKPIFIITHYPLHYTTSRTINGAGTLINTLNTAATTNGQKIVFLWGHNHTDADKTNVETHYDEIFAPDETIQYSSSQSAQLKFYYAAAGCMSDSDYGTGSGAVKGKGLIVTINNESKLTFTYYDANGTDVTEEGSYTEKDPVAINSVTIDEATEIGDDGQVHVVVPEVEVGKKIQLHYTTDPPEATVKTVTWESLTPDIASVENGKVKGLQPGTARIKMTISDGITRGTAETIIEIEVLPKSTTGTTYVRTDTMEVGKNYIIANKEDGAAYALTNNNGSVSATAVTVEDDEIYVDDEIDYGNLVFTTEGSGSTVTAIGNDGRYLSASGNSLTLSTSAPTNRTWAYGTDNKLTVKGSGSSSSTYYVYYSTYNGGRYTASTSSSSSSSPRELYLYEEIKEQIPVSSVTISSEEETIEERANLQLTATVLPENATNRKVTWETSNKNKATVDSTGKVRGVEEGDVTITARSVGDPSKTATCLVHVTPRTSPDPNYVIVIDNYALSTERSPNTANSGSSSYTYTGLAGVAYSSGDAADNSIRWIIEETTGGYYIMSKDGRYLNATYVSGNNSGQGDLKLDDTPDVWVLDSGYSLSDGEVDGSKLKSTNASNTATSDKFLSYEDSANLFTVRSESNADTITIEEPTDPIKVTSLTLDKTQETVEVRKPVQLTATVLPENATNKKVNWESSDSETATVDANGKVRGVKEGTVTITAKSDEDPTIKAECVVTVVPSTSTDPTYVITIGNFALSTDTTNDRLSNNNGAYIYTGLAGVAFDPDVTPDENISWILEETDGGYYIKSLDGRYLNATYTSASNPSSSNPTRGVLKLDNTPDVWVMDGTLEQWEVDGSMLKSTNASSTASSDKFLAYEEGTTSDPLNLFTIRSEGNADETVLVDPTVTIEERYTETDRFVDGKEYIIAVTKLDDEGNPTDTVFVIKNTSGANTGNTGSATMTVVPASGSEAAYIDTDDTDVVWKYASSNQYLSTSNSHYLGYESNTYLPRVSSQGRAIIYSGGKLQISSGHYLTCTNEGTFATSTSSGEGVAVRLFEKNRVIIDDTCVHELTPHEAKPATCTEPGNIDYWTCSKCGKFFSDAEGKTEITEAQTVIPKEEHTWGNVTYTWAEDNSTATATRECSVCHEKETETVNAVIDITQPTCTEAGYTTYTADFENEVFETQTKKVDGEAASGHIWSDVEYTWAEDNSTATATRECSVCHEKETETVNAVIDITQPTCTEAGYTTYTADFENEAFETQTKKVDGEDATGHTWGDVEYTWAIDNLKVTATRICKNDASHKETETVAATYAVIKEATETEAGLGRYTSAAFENPAFGVQTKDVTLQPTGEEADPDTRPDSAPDGTAVGPGASAAAAEKAITNCNSDEGPSGTKFGPLSLRSKKQTKSSIKLSWNKVSGTKKYVIYGNKCGKKNKMKKLATVTGNKMTFKKVAGKKIKKGTYYKFIVVAVDSKDTVVSASKTIHIATKGGKVTNHKSVKTKAKKNKVSLKTGKTFKLRAKGVSQNKKLKVRKHRAIKYESTNTKIATVSKKGVIKAKARGTCYVYAYAQSGVFKKIKVTVK